MGDNPLGGLAFPRVHLWCELEPRNPQIDVIYRGHHPKAIDPMCHSLDEVTPLHEPLPSTQRHFLLSNLSAGHQTPLVGGQVGEGACGRYASHYRNIHHI